MRKLGKIEENREQLLASYPDINERIASIRGNALSKLPNHIQEALESLKGKGNKVYYAKNNEEAQGILKALINGEKSVVRTHSKTLMEIGFDHFMSELGVEVHKSNINEIILDALNKKSEGHPLLQDLSSTKDEQMEGLKKALGTDSSEPIELKRLIQKKIKEQIVQSEFGITGIDSVIAENGTIILAEDEGNGRIVSNLPYKHVVVAGIDKLYYSAEDALTAIKGMSIYGLGRKVPTYLSLISGPSRTADIEMRMAYGMHGPKEVHVILLDNGREELLEMGQQKILSCIECGACFGSLKEYFGNDLDEVALTPKSILLALNQGRVSKFELQGELSDFICPVNITPADIIDSFKKI